MKIGVTVDLSEFNADKVEKAVESDRVWLFAAQQWHRHYSKYVPMETGTLDQSVQYSTEKCEGVITHSIIYAHYQYEGNFDHVNVPHPLYHPLASRHWDEAAVPTELQPFANELGAFIAKEIDRL